MQYGKLYLVATPIGNLEDITVRALNVLKEVSLIACEDTRHSLKLFNHFDIQKPLTSYFEHNKKEKGEYILSVLKEGNDVALVTDAGTPAISDPGEDLVAMCAENGIDISVIPGPCAAICALATSGLPTGRFTFEGFLPQKKGRATRLAELSLEPRTFIIYESPLRLTKTLSDLANHCGLEREASVSREISKIHNSTIRGTLDYLITYFQKNAPKGEIVIVVAGYTEDKKEKIHKNKYKMD